MNIQRLFAVLLAVAVLFAPAITRAGEARASVPEHSAQMMEAGHCQSPPSDTEEDDKAAEKSCCVAMCAGVAVTAPTAVGGSGPAPAPAISAIDSLHRNYLGEIATPPPKFAGDQRT